MAEHHAPDVIEFQNRIEAKQQAIRRIESRIVQLRAFDLDSIKTKNDERPLEGLCHKYNDTLLWVLGDDFTRIRQYSLKTLLGKANTAFASEGYSPKYQREAYRDGIARAIINLECIKEGVEEEISEETLSFGRPARELPSDDSGLLALYEGMPLHPKIVEAVGERFVNGHYEDAVLKAYQGLEQLVQQKSGRKDTGAALMEKVFSPKNPFLIVGDLANETGQNEQNGMHRLFSGVALAFRNPRAHTLQVDEPERALERIALLSLLAYEVDNAETGPS